MVAIFADAIIDLAISAIACATATAVTEIAFAEAEPREMNHAISAIIAEPAHARDVMHIALFAPFAPAPIAISITAFATALAITEFAEATAEAVNCAVIAFVTDSAIAGIPRHIRVNSANATAIAVIAFPPQIVAEATALVTAVPAVTILATLTMGASTAGA